jgi:alpha-D-ribose 1-methylphosphonate 5-triphosphate synthase subunit PhnI
VGYLAVKGSQAAIDAARRLAAPTGGRETVDAVGQHLPLAVAEVQAEAGLYEPRLAATAFTQARGDVSEAAFLLRGYRSTLPRRTPARADSAELRPARRISSAFRTVPGGQVLGATNDYGLRLLDPELSRRADRSPDRQDAREGADPATGATGAGAEGAAGTGAPVRMPKVLDHLRREGLVARRPAQPPAKAADITRTALRFPATRSARLQALARGQSGAMTAFAYANLRGYGPFHPTLAELRVGMLPVTVAHPRTGRPVQVGEIEVTEAEALGQKPQQEGRTLGVGYGCVLGRCERKAIAMAVLDAVLSGLNDDTPFDSPLADEEFVLAHVDGLEASGFVEHMKLPHEVTFASDLDRVRSIQDRSAPAGGDHDQVEGAR